MVPCPKVVAGQPVLFVIIKCPNIFNEKELIRDIKDNIRELRQLKNDGTIIQITKKNGR
jgi:hypothetical protein